METSSTVLVEVGFNLRPGGHLVFSCDLVCTSEKPVSVGLHLHFQP
jgi:hypothetical protein